MERICIFQVIVCRLFAITESPMHRLRSLEHRRAVVCAVPWFLESVSVSLCVAHNTILLRTSSNVCVHHRMSPSQCETSNAFSKIGRRHVATIGAQSFTLPELPGIPISSTYECEYEYEYVRCFTFFFQNEYTPSQVMHSAPTRAAQIQYSAARSGYLLASSSLLAQCCAHCRHRAGV